MKRIICISIFSSIMTVYGQGLGIGVRVGDPEGITIKKYLGNDALELSIGQSNLFYNNGLDSKFFNDWISSKSLHHQTMKYSRNNSSAPFGFQLHYLYQHILTPSLHWYLGYGVQFRVHKCSYTFHYKLPNDTSWHYTTGGIVTDLDIGADGVIGIEFTPPKIPVSLFLDATVFMEIMDDPFVFWAQGGVGLRFNFGGGSRGKISSSQ